ncbi:MAG: histidinol-phosphatase [Ignavibacteriales bacterium]|nr:histidinol-phosphatase [Ignavibacteriales bacterium]
MTNEFFPFIKHIARGSGEIINRYYRTPIAVESKADESPVTIADKKTEEYIREEIMKEFPEHGIVGEEFGSYQADAEYVWVLDPIDGTKSFICGVPLFGTLIAIKKGDEVIAGAFHQPVLRELLLGDNAAAWLNDERVYVRECNDISKAVFLNTDHLNVYTYQNGAGFEQLIRKVKLFRGWGDCYGYYLLATGFADIMMDPIMNPWDTLALVPIIRGAGGIITDYQGGNPVTGSSVIAAAPGIHAEVVRILNGLPE